MPIGVYQALLSYGAVALDPFQVDGFTSNSFTGGGGTLTTGASFSVTHNNCVVIAFVVTRRTAAGFITTSSVAGAGLTWTLRKRFQAASGSNVNIEEWRAITTIPFTSQSVTATFSGTADSGAILVFGVSGADTTTPFDANVAVPATAFAAAASNPTVNVSTTNANCMLIGLVQNEQGSTITAGAGFTLAGSIASNAGVETQVVSAAQSGTAVAFGLQNQWSMIADAIRKHP